MTDTQRLPVYAISHGGGPWPWMMDRMPFDMSVLHRSLTSIPTEVGMRPRAVLAVSAHWETRELAVQTHPQPPMLYDYTGFPPDTYEIQYPAPGSPEVAEEVAGLLEAAGLPVHRDAQRGFDHGVFSTLYPMYPEADVPVVQLSIRADFDPEFHLEVGRLLSPLRDRGVLILGSGLPSFHDLSKFGPASADSSREFDAWLTETVVETIGAERSKRLAHWDQAPSARECHPREDHFVPLIVAAGAAEDDPGRRQYHEDAFLGFTSSSGYRFDAAA